jgi:hypothetical protein
MQTKILLLIFLCAFCLYGQKDNAPGGRSLDKTVSEESFKNPPLQYRPMPMMHNASKEAVLKAKDLGYGGVVTNVSFVDYLQSEEKWSEFQDITGYTIDSLGMGMWIYDELGYPSGAAGGLVLKNNPDWQSKGLVYVSASSDRSLKIQIEKPYGHLRLITAFAYKGDSLDNIDFSTAKNLSSFSDPNGKVIWKAPGKGWLVVCTYLKYFYEGTHATSNWVAKRRYIDILRKEPVQKFIDVTYKPYFEKVGKYFGRENGISAFFTDEPSLMGTYFMSPPPVEPAIEDQPDDKIPFLPVINYSDSLLSQFKKLYGYDLSPFMPALFGGNSQAAKQVRWDYYKMLSGLVSDNYTGLIGDFCSRHNVAMSGHLLLEEDIMRHPIFEGNYLQIYSRMQYPGIDMLTAYPETALIWSCTTAKLAASSALLYGKKHVMSEVSDAFDAVKNDIYGRLGSVAVQFALGVDHFNSYYQVNKTGDDENRLFTNTIGRMGYMLSKGTQVTDVALYYPIEGIWAETTPPASLNNFNPQVQKLSDNFRDLSLSMLRRQVDYTYIDYNILDECSVKNNRIVTKAGLEFSVIVLPLTPSVDSKVIKLLLKAADSGVHIILQSKENIFAEKGSSPSFPGEYASLLNNSNVSIVEDINLIPAKIKTLLVPEVKLDKENNKILFTKRQNDNSSVYMLVNISKDEQLLNVEFHSTGGNIKLWDPYTGSSRTLSAEKTASGSKINNIKIEAEKSVFITFEK